jgi:hypothetical protein
MKRNVTRCPLPFACPFLPPWRRSLGPDSRHRFIAWCDESLPGVAVEIVEWVGADTRQPLHAVVVAFPGSDRPPVVLYLKVEDIRRHHLVRALERGAGS